MPTPPRPITPLGTATFVSGTTMRHVAVMAATSAIGLVAVFFVDLVNLFYLSLLGPKPLAAALGFAAAIGFFQISIAIGITIGLGSVVSAAIGAGDRPRARMTATHGLIVMTALLLALGIATALARWPLLRLLHADGTTALLAARYLAVTAPTAALIALGMGAAALLRADGQAKRAMNVTLGAAFAVALLDPLFIFGLHMGLMGAAISTVLSRIILAGLGLFFALQAGLLSRPSRRAFVASLRPVGHIAGPAILANLATPVGTAFVTHAMAGFGTAAVAGQATVDRMTPVAFGLVYAVSGAVGPIIAQNRGAGRLDRVATTLRDSLIFTTLAVFGAWAILAIAAEPIIRLFSAKGETAALIALFCHWTAGGFLFLGALFVTNAVCNNLDRPGLAMLLNWGRATLGTIPFVWVGAQFGPRGVLIGQALGSIPFAILGILVARHLVRRAGGDRAEAGVSPEPGAAGTPLPSGFSTIAGFLTRPRRQ